MATITKTGAITGKLGDRVYYILNGKQCVRSCSTAIKAPPSPKQAATNARMAVTSPVAKSFKELVKTTYRTADRLSPYNQLVRNILSEAITEEAGSPRIDFSKIKVSAGRLLQPVAVFAKSEGCSIHFTWKRHYRFFSRHGNNRAVLVAYCEALQQCTFTVIEDCCSKGESTLDASVFKNHTVHTWLGFITADGKGAADSVYTGKVPVGFSGALTKFPILR